MKAWFTDALRKEHAVWMRNIIYAIFPLRHMRKDYSSMVKDIIRKYTTENVQFTKSHMLDWLSHRNGCSIQDMKEEIIGLKNFVFAERQVIDFQGQQEIRYRCYFVYSHSRGRCYIIRTNHALKVITVFPLGRQTLTKYRKKFK